MSGPVNRFLRAPCGRTDRFGLAFLAIGLITLTIVSFILRNRSVVAAGGNVWIDGDWLISFAAGPVRRGLSGYLVFWLSDLVHTSPLIIIETIQDTSLIALAAGVVISLIRLQLRERIAILLMSPAFFLFWHNEFMTHGKEIFATLAFLPLLFAAMRGRTLVLAHALSAALYELSAFLHEAALLFGPFLLLCSLAICARHKHWRLFITYAFTLALLGGAALVFVVTYTSLPDVAPLCAEVTRRGLDPKLCGTSIAWLLNDFHRALQFTNGIESKRHLIPVVIAAVLAYVPIVVLLRPAIAVSVQIAAIAATVLIFLPLYFVSIDYGRWLNMQIVAITLTVLTAASTSSLPGLDRPMPRWTAYGLAALAMIWRVDVATGGFGSGVLKPVVEWALGLVGAT